MTGQPVMAAGTQAARDDADAGEEFYDKDDTEIVITIKEVSRHPRSAGRRSGRWRRHLRGYQDGTVFLHMKGACAGCPSSTATLKHRIQNLLKHFVPEVQHVEQVA